MPDSKSQAAVITVRVIPRAATSGPAGVRDGAYVIRLHAPPVDGAANIELIETLADLLDVPKRSVTIVAGERSRTKRVRIAGRTDAEAREALG